MRSVAQHALVAPRRSPQSVGVAILATLCGAGLLLSGSSPTVQGAVAVPATSVRQDVDTLSRGAIDREAQIVVPTSETPTAEPTPTSAGSTALYVVSSANLRSQPSTSSTVLTTLATGTKVLVSGPEADGWQTVTAGSRTGYIKSSLLSATPPSPKSTASSAGAASGAYPACASGSAVESGLHANTILVHRAVCTTFPEVTSYNGLRGDGTEHATGRALDIMTSGARGQEIAAWLRANYATLGITEIIYQQRIWTTQRASEGWRAMADRGSVTANHYDHIHVLTS